MKILIAEPEKAFCLHIPLGLVCNRVGAALLAGGLRATKLLPASSGSITAEQTTLITSAQLYDLLKALRQSGKALKQAGLPLLDIEEKDGSRILITL